MFLDESGTYEAECNRKVANEKRVSGARGLLGIRRMDKVPNAWIRQLCGVTKGKDQKIDEGVLRWFGHVERMENDRIAKRVYVRQCAGSRSVGKTRKR